MHAERHTAHVDLNSPLKPCPRGIQRRKGPHEVILKQLRASDEHAIESKHLSAHPVFCKELLKEHQGLDPRALDQSLMGPHSLDPRTLDKNL